MTSAIQNLQKCVSMTMNKKRCSSLSLCPRPFHIRLYHLRTPIPTSLIILRGGLESIEETKDVQEICRIPLKANHIFQYFMYVFVYGLCCSKQEMDYFLF